MMGAAAVVVLGIAGLLIARLTVMGQISFGALRVKWVRPVSLDVYLGPVLFKTVSISEGTGPMDLNLSDNQDTTIHLRGFDAAGLEGAFTKPPVWTVDDPTIVAITPDPDGRTCKVGAAVPAKLGNAVLTVTDADDPSVSPLTFNITVGAENITRLGATIDPPVERAPAA